MDFWHWVFAALSGALAGWSLVGYRRAGEAHERGHLLRGLVAAALACLFLYTGLGAGWLIGVLTFGLSVVGFVLTVVLASRYAFRTRTPASDDGSNT